ncbi:MAG TPA: hypothetical protein VIU40_03995 [Geobacteraceae bacterium]
MVTRNFLIVMCLALMGTLLFWGVGQWQARAEETTRPTAKTAPARDPQSIPKLRSTTNAQREEAARKAAEYRAEAARAAALGNATTSKPVSPPQEKGGAK